MLKFGTHYVHREVLNGTYARLTSMFKKPDTVLYVASSVLNQTLKHELKTVQNVFKKPDSGLRKFGLRVDLPSEDDTAGIFGIFVTILSSF